MAFAQLRFIRHLLDDLASVLVPAPSAVVIGAQHRSFARTLRHINSADGRSFAPFNHRFAPAHDWLGKTNLPTQVVTDPTSRQFADRAVVAATNIGVKNDNK